MKKVNRVILGTAAATAAVGVAYYLFKKNYLGEDIALDDEDFEEEEKPLETIDEKEEKEAGNQEFGELNIDTDGDGKNDAVVIDINGDGKPDSIGFDTDGNGTVDVLAMDTTGDENLDTVVSTEE